MDTAKEVKEEETSPEAGSRYEEEANRNPAEPSMSIDKDEEVTSPFRLPSDEEVFVTREAEKKRLQELKEKQKKLKIWEKKTASTHAGLKRPKETDIPPAEIRGETGKKGKKKKELIQAALDIVRSRIRGGGGKDLGEKKQAMQEFVDQKKEMFLVVKTTGILSNEKLNLEKMANERESALILYNNSM